ncbi:MAG TPA: VOC family protein [Actinomycetota bacterium]|nr:VOC family protein [Actinomycetota bacterium]
MPEFTSHKEGTFSFADLQTSDLEAATRFYTDLFGWGINDQPMSEDPTDIYREFTKGGKDVCGASKQRPEQAEAGVPPMWNTYFTVSDVDLTAKEIEAAGGTVHAPPFDVFDVGRMAVAADPAGAFFCLWQPKTSIGSYIMQEPNTLTWTECGSTDTEKSKAFYTQVFGWTSEDQDMGPGGTYTVFSAHDAFVAGLMKSQMPMSYWLIYFAVEDCKAMTEKVRAGGGQVMMDSDPIPGVGTVSVVTDPQGAMFGMIEAAPQTNA